MATLTLLKLFINRMDSGDALSANTDPARQQQYEVEGSVRPYAGGRQRSIQAVGERAQWTFALVDVSLATIATLRAWVGVVVQVRDHRGQRAVGVYYAVQVAEKREAAFYNVALTLFTVTVDEEV